MKKALFAVVLLLLCAGGGYGVYHYMKHKEEVKNIQANKWTIERMDKMSLQGIAIDNDSLITNALDALLTKKIQDKELNGTLLLTLCSSDIDFSAIKNLSIKISNNATSITDTLQLSPTANKKADCELTLTSENIAADKAETVLQFIEDIYTRNNITIEVKPDFGNGYTEWTGVSVPSYRPINRIEDIPSDNGINNGTPQDEDSD